MLISPTPPQVVRKATVQTTDGTLTTALSHPIPPSTCLGFVVKVRAHQASNDAGWFYVGAACAKRVGSGAAALVGAGFSLYSAQEDDAAFNIDIAVSGNNAIVRVVGVAAKTVDWAVVLEVT